MIRAGFDCRDAVLRQFPATFNVPNRLRKMVVADLADGDAGAGGKAPVEGAPVAPWELPRTGD